MDAHVDTLISEQASFILARSGLGNVYTVYQENKMQKVTAIVLVSCGEIIKREICE